MSLYGYCPQCGERGVRRERRLGGNDTCEAGHTYPTAQSHSQPDALIARLTRENSDRAAELARVEDDFLKMNNLAYEWRVRAERAEAYVAGQDVRSDFRNAGEMRIALDATVGELNTAMKEHTLLRAECDAWRAFRKAQTDGLCSDVGDAIVATFRYAELLDAVDAARAATDAAGILRDGNSEVKQ